MGREERPQSIIQVEQFLAAFCAILICQITRWFGICFLTGFFVHISGTFKRASSLRLFIRHTHAQPPFCNDKAN